MKNILIIKGSSQYNVARYFCDELQQGFCNLGCLVTVLDLTVFPDIDCPDLFAQFDMIFSFDVAGIELYNTMSVKPFFWTMLIDPPIYLNERLKQINGNVMVSCIDRRHVSYIDRYYKNIPWTCFMPHGGITGEVPTRIPYHDRKYSVIIMGSLQQLDGINAVINSLLNDYDPLVTDIIEASMEAPDSNLDVVVSSCLKDRNMDFDDNMFREFMYIIRAIDALRRYRKRERLIKELINTELSVDIWGSGWEQVINSSASKIKLHGNISYGEAKYIIRDSKVLINDMPPYHEGSHERVFAAMHTGTIVASDRSIFLEDCFCNGKDIIFYDHDNIEALSTDINELLNDTVKAQNIIDNAYNLSLNHTWTIRAATVLEITDRIYHSIKEI